MSKHGHCSECKRVFRSKASRELAEARSAIIADLKASVSVSTSNHGKRERKQLASAEFRQHGDAY